MSDMAVAREKIGKGDVLAALKTCDRVLSRVNIHPETVRLDARVDYFVCEALAELTLAILQKDRQRDEALGYTRDLPLYVAAAVPHILAGHTKLITNAGGINPIGAGRAVVDALRA